MKKNIFLIIACLWVFPAMAQDILVTNEGEALKVYNLEVGESAVFYQLENKDGAEIMKMTKKDILVIKKQDGTKLDFSQTAPTATQPETTQSATALFPTYTEEEQAQITAANQKLIDEMNGDYFTFEEKTKDKVANICLLTMGVKENSVLHNGDLTVSYEFGQLNTDKKTLSPLEGLNSDAYWWGFSVILKNNTTKTIYMDLGNTFIVQGSNAIAYYIPTVTSSTTISSGGAGVNLGAVTGSLGIGGAIGTLASGINVGGGKSSSSTSVVFSQRIVAIPPMSSKRLEPKLLSDQENATAEWLGFRRIPGGDKRQAVYWMSKEMQNIPGINRGEKYTFEKDNSVLDFSLHISYSFEESCSQLQSLRTNFYLKEIIGTGYYNGLIHTINSVKLRGDTSKSFSFYVFREK